MLRRDVFRFADLFRKRELEQYASLPLAGRQGCPGSSYRGRLGLDLLLTVHQEENY